MRHFRQEWIEALESGRFPQTFGRLKDGDARCAMGVAIDVLSEYADKIGFSKSTPLNTQQMIPELLGLTHRQCALISRMNDKCLMSHAEIAHVLRQLDRRESLIATEHDPAVWANKAPLERSDEATPRD